MQRRSWARIQRGFALMIALCGLGYAGFVISRSGMPGHGSAIHPIESATSARLTNSHFGPMPKDPHALPEFSLIPIPDFPGMHAICGATGRDSRGRIWVGVSAVAWQGNTPSAHLMEYLPGSEEVLDRGDVVAQLRLGGFYREGESQEKIHSRIVEASDRCLYFASLSEHGLSETDGSHPTRWGSHLWKLQPATAQWQHLLTAPEGLIAVAGAGADIYALGYYGHVLYHYDVNSGKIRSVRVGSVGRHYSRNLLCDERGHVYVPRLKYTMSIPSELIVTLVEFDPALRQVAESPIEHYADTVPDDSHGIVSFQYLADRSIVFATHLGYLYQVVPDAKAAAVIRPIGWFHPEGPAYVASMFTYEGRRYLLGAARRRVGTAKRYEWLIYDLQKRSSEALPLEPVILTRSLSGLSPLRVGDSRRRRGLLPGRPGRAFPARPVTVATLQWRRVPRRRYGPGQVGVHFNVQGSPFRQGSIPAWDD